MFTADAHCDTLYSIGVDNRDPAALTITAEKNLDKKDEDKEGRLLRQERYAGTLSRSFYVGDHVTEDQIHAAFENGVLTITIPKEQPKVPEKKTILIA